MWFILAQEFIFTDEVVTEARSSAEAHGGGSEALTHAIHCDGKISPVARDGTALVEVAEEVGLHGTLLGEAGNADAEQPHRHARRPNLVEQLAGHAHEDVLVVGGMREAALRASPLTICVVQLHRDGMAGESFTAQPPAHGFTEQREGGLDVGALREVVRKRALVTHGFHLVGRVDGRDATLFAPGSAQTHRLGVHAEDRSQARCGRRSELAERMDADLFERLFRRGTDPAHRAHGQRFQKARFRTGRHHREPTRLHAIARDLRDRLVRPQADRAGDTELAHAPLDAPRDVYGVFTRKAPRRDVEERLIDRDLIHIGRLVREDRHDLGTHLAITVEVAVRPDSMRAQAHRLGRRHRRMDAERSCLV